MVLGDASNTYYYGFTTDGVFTEDPLVERGDVDTSVYHTYQMVMDPAGGADGLLTYYVDGAAVHTELRNALASTANKFANFGDGNESGAADFQFSELTLATGQNVVPEPATMLLLAAKATIEETNNKIAELQTQVRTPAQRRIEALEDVCWAILYTNEFLFQH